MSYGANASHRVMNSSWTKAALNNLKTPALAEDHVFRWDADIFKRDVAMAVRRVVIAEDGQHAMDGDSRCTSGDKNHRLLVMGIRVFGIRLAHDDVYFASRIASSAAPPFLDREQRF